MIISNLANIKMKILRGFKRRKDDYVKIKGRELDKAKRKKMRKCKEGKTRKEKTHLSMKEN